MEKNGRWGMLTAALLITLLTLPLSAFSEQKIDEKRDVNRDCDISIDNLSGSVSVTAWDKNEIHITGTLGEGAERLAIEGGKESMDIRVEIPENARNVEDTFLEIKVPRMGDLTISTVSADITVDGTQGEMDLNAVSGDITAGGKPKRARINAVSGDISAELETTDLYANSVSGEIEIRRVGGEVTAETVSGDVAIKGGSVERLRVNAFSGDIDVEVSPAKGAAFSLDAHSGDISLVLPKDLDAKISVSSFSGDIDSEFGTGELHTSGHGPGSELSFTVGSGDASIKINTFSGDARLTKK